MNELVDSLPAPVGFVLGGGGSLGAAQVGMIQALHDHGIHADFVAGTSIGSLNGAIVAADPKGAASRLAHIWHNLDVDAMLPPGLLRRLRAWRRSKNALYDTPEIGRLIENEIGGIDIEELSVPYSTMVVDVEAGDPVQIDSGPLISAVLASSAIPGVFPAIERDGRLLYDGGIVRNVPMSEAVDMGARSLVVLDCAFPGQRLRPPASLAEAMFFAGVVQNRHQSRREAAELAESVPVLYLPGAAPTMVSPLDFSHTPALVRDAYTVSRSFLSTVSVDGPGLYETAAATPAAAAHLCAVR